MLEPACTDPDDVTGTRESSRESERCLTPISLPSAETKQTVAPGSSRPVVSRRERDVVLDGVPVSLSRGVEVALWPVSPEAEDRLPDLCC